MEKERTITVDLCVVGAGMAGICAAVAAARRGLKVALVHDRPVVGGNASSEIRVWIRGASTLFPDYREGGVIEELASDNIRYNPDMNFSQWDAVLYNKLVSEKNIELFLNSTCVDAFAENGKISEIKAWQLTSYTYLRIRAEYFADCSGDCILAEPTGAKYRKGRESRGEFGESLALEKCDSRTMGNSCMLQAHETDKPVSYIAPPFAYKFCDEDFAHRLDIYSPIDLRFQNFWWLEIGGDGDALADSEAYNRELISRAYGIWDYIKNSGRFSCENWELDWVGCLAGKRETRRYKGDYILTQNDIDEARHFQDEVAYGGWSMDDHNPAGIKTSLPPNIHHPVKSPYSIPYRCLYSENIENLFFAGRNISATHMALSSTRVMATCALMGQAVGTACAVAKKYAVSPRGVLGHIEELQQMLRDDDCYLLHTPRRVSATMKNAETNLTSKEKEVFFSGIERDTDGVRRALIRKKGEVLSFCFKKAVFCNSIRIVFDNDISGNRYPEDAWFLKLYPNRGNVFKNMPRAFFNPSLAKAYRIYIHRDGRSKEIRREKDNFLRLIKISVAEEIDGLEFVCDETYGADEVGIFSIDIL